MSTTTKDITITTAGSGPSEAVVETLPVTVKIANETATFPKRLLMQLPYFEAMLADRWKPNTSKPTKNKKNGDENLNNRKKDIIDIFQDDSATFTMKVFTVFLNTLKCRKIPENCSLTLSEIESFVACANFFLPEYNVRETLYNYIKNCKPGISPCAT